MQNLISQSDDLINRHIQCGFWDHDNDPRHGYVLCPEPYVLSSSWKNQLTTLGVAVSSFQNGLPNLFEKICNGKSNFLINTNHLFKQANHGLPVYNEGVLPLVKVDIMVNSNDELKIAEIDGYNPRAIAYTALLRDLHLLTPSGIEKVIAELVISRGYKKLAWIYAHHERYYSRAINQFARILKKNFDIEVLTFDTENYIDENKLSNCAILIIPWGMRTATELINQDKLIDLYRKDSNKFLYPLTPWVGSKGLLGIASNATNKPELEELASSFSDINLIRKFVPKTALVGWQYPETKLWADEMNEYVLKLNVSSGLKGVWFSGNNNPECRNLLEEKWRHKKSTSIVQEFVNQKKVAIKTINSTENEEWYVRLIAYIDQYGKVVDLCLTGRKTPDVHGSTDCILLPCV